MIKYFFISLMLLINFGCSNESNPVEPKQNPKVIQYTMEMTFVSDSGYYNLDSISITEFMYTNKNSDSVTETSFIGNFTYDNGSGMYASAMQIFPYIIKYGWKKDYDTLYYKKDFFVMGDNNFEYYLSPAIIMNGHSIYINSTLHKTEDGKLEGSGEWSWGNYFLYRIDYPDGSWKWFPCCFEPLTEYPFGGKFYIKTTKIEEVEKWWE